jgi:L-fuculose-phosphate aldolase
MKAESDEAGLREAVLDAARAMSVSRLSPGCSGNVSARLGEGMVITPSGVAYEGMSADDLVRVAGDGTPEAHRYKPSSEWRFHLAVYAARPEAGAIVHTHSRHATVLACAEKTIPAFHYMVAVAGGSDIRCSPYATFGTKELADYVVAALEGRRACLMAHHGQLAFGKSPQAALELAGEVEELAAQYCELLKIGGGAILDNAEMARVLERFKTYGAGSED